MAPGQKRDDGQLDRIGFTDDGLFNIVFQFFKFFSYVVYSFKAPELF